MDNIIVVLISDLCVGVPSVIATMMSNNKSNALLNYCIDELIRQVEKHNSVVERMALQEREIKALWKKITQLKKDLENHK